MITQAPGDGKRRPQLFKSYNHYKSILFIRSNSVSDFRIEFAMRHLERAGYHTEIISETPFHKVGQYDLYIASRPGDSMLNLLNDAVDAGKPVIVDLDDDFNSIPKHNPAYPYVGAGHPTYLRELNKFMHRSGVLVTYSTDELVKRYHTDGIVIPNGWDSENELWAGPKKTGSDITNVGWSGTTTHREDFKLIENPMHHILNNRPDVRFVINNDFEIYKKYSASHPPYQTLFLPGVPFSDYPEIFKYIDILLVPLRDTHFNRAKSDIKMIECGASSTFWMASPIPFYAAWNSGGVLVPDGEWEEQIMTFLDLPAARDAAVEEAHVKAATRTDVQMGEKWVAVVNELLGVEGSDGI